MQVEALEGLPTGRISTPRPLAL